MSNPGHRPPYETAQIWIRAGERTPAFMLAPFGFERGADQPVIHLGVPHTLFTRTDVDTCGQVWT